MVAAYPAADQSGSRKLRFSLLHLLYAFALLAASWAVLGLPGTLLAAVVVGLWAYVFASRSGSRALLYVILGVGLLVCCPCWLPTPYPYWLPIPSPGPVGTKTMCGINLKQLALALDMYHGRYGTLPPASVADEDGRPMHSWRVLLLPFVEQTSLYEQYNFDEPWDGPDNRQLIERMPSVYRCPSAPRSTHTSYLAVVGPDTAWPGDSGRAFAEFSGGLASTLLLVEVADSGVSWLEPRDLSMDEALRLLTDRRPESPGHRLSNYFEEWSSDRAVVFADARSDYLPYGAPADLIDRLLWIDASADVTEWDRERIRWSRPKYGNWWRLTVLLILILWPLPWVWRGRGRPARGAYSKDCQPTVK